MEPADTHFENHVNGLIGRYGRLDFFEQALEKQKVTRHMINRADHKNFFESLFFHFISIGVIAFGFSGYSNALPKELSFLIPVGVVMLWAVRQHSRKVKTALYELSKFAVGLHAEKLAKQ